MPKIKSFAPSWLNEPSPGHRLFQPSVDNVKAQASLPYGKKPKPGPRRTIARRGTEVFVAVEKEIRWGDLVTLKESWETTQARSFDGNNTAFEGGYRTIKTPVADDIRQLVMSPNQDFLAVLTCHTVHICILPDSSHLHTTDTTPFKPKFWTLGPTTHVTSRSAVVSALWHPLGVNGTALVTVTEDAVVRVWELSTGDRWTFDAPTLSVDLKRLADGTSLDQDFSASTSATNKSFSPDDFDMEVAAACFPARDSGNWSPMTLWLAMAGGDVYALCPLLPQRWAPSPTLIPSLSVSVIARKAAMEDDPEATPEERLLAQQQLEWMSDLDNQDSRIVDGEEVYTRPTRPGMVPRLQGPFDFDLNPEDEQDDEVELKDIYVVGQKADMEDLMYGEDDEFEMDDERDGLSLTVVCLLSTSGQVKICLDVDGVEAQWLPPKSRHRSRSFTAPTTPSLLTFQTFDTLKPVEVNPDSWPMFSEDVTSPYAFYITHPAAITYVSLAPWVSRLESELQGESEAGAQFRLDVLAQGQGSDRERIYTQARGQSILAAATAICDPDLGHFVLSATNRDPIALFFDTPEPVIPSRESPEAAPQQLEQPPQEIGWEPRPLFRPSQALEPRNAVTQWVDHLKTSRRRPLLQQELRLSMATLEMFTDSHKIVANEVEEINSAVAELFRKCEALQSELREQIEKANKAKKRVDRFTGEDSADEEPVTERNLVQDRLRAARERQEELASRMEKLKRRIGRTSSRELSDKERAWAEEVRALEASIVGSYADHTAATPRSKQPWKRFEEIKVLRDALFSQAEQLRAREGADDETPASPAPSLRIPAEIRRAKLAQVVSLLDRESVLVDAVKSRIERLSLG
ncbi:Nucleoporin nup82 [Collariella sp. IMI 366227]|nr:Nucleoporin nup82 [Collariella sp. IMI 366227]